MHYKVVDIILEDFIQNIKKYFENKKNTILFDKRNVIKIVEFENKKYVVKSFKIPHLINKIVYRFFRDSKAKRSYENSIKLLELNINTPKPIGYVEYTTLFFFKESYYVSEFFDYDFEIREVFSNLDFEKREVILEKFVDYSFMMHNKGVYHIDYSPGNILVKKNADEYEFSIIDVNRMQFKEFDIDLRMKSMSKLTSNTQDNHFMATYYAKLMNVDADMLISKFDFYLQEQQNYLEKKRKLKKLKRKK